MPAITITFGVPLNVSCQVGDTAYFVNYPTNTFGGFNVSSTMQLIGVINTITETTSGGGTGTTITGFTGGRSAFTAGR